MGLPRWDGSRRDHVLDSDARVILLVQARTASVHAAALSCEESAMPMNLESLIDLVGLGAHRDFVLGLARPTVELVPVDDVDRRVGTRLGGAPDVPAGFPWPRTAEGVYRFVAQIRLEDLSPDPTREGLPERGLLSFFYAADYDAWWRDADFVRVFWFRDADGLVRADPPTFVAFPFCLRSRLVPGQDVPPWPRTATARAAWPLDASLEDAWWDLRRRLHPSGRYLFGFPLNRSLAYDPTPGPGWRSLLTLDSSEALKWSWRDDAWLVTFIESERLRAHDFSAIRADAG